MSAAIQDYKIEDTKSQTIQIREGSCILQGSLEKRGRSLVFSAYNDNTAPMKDLTVLCLKTSELSTVPVDEMTRDYTYIGCVHFDNLRRHVFYKW